MKREEKVNLFFFASEILIIFLISLSICSVADPLTTGRDSIRSWFLLLSFIGILFFMIKTESRIRKEMQKKNVNKKMHR